MNNITPKRTDDQAPFYFHQGTNFRAYEYLGVHKRSEAGKWIYTFRVWAPHADQVFVVGDFNGWCERDEMHRVTVPREVIDRAGEYAVCYQEMADRKPYYPEHGDTVRRRLREIYRLNEEQFLPGWDIVVVARSRCVDADFKKLTHAYLSLAQKAGVLKTQ